jgi:hypothetical protein
MRGHAGGLLVVGSAPLPSGLLAHCPARGEAIAARARELEAAEHPERAQERARQGFLTSPIGQATTAKEQGQGFFEIQLEVGSSQRDTRWSLTPLSRG